MKIFLFSGLVLLAAVSCAPKSPTALLSRYGLVPSTPKKLVVCTSFGCRDSKSVSLSTEESRTLSTLFTPPAQTPAEERGRIATSISWLEHRVGAKAGFSKDLGENQWDPAGSPQLDCIAEAANTTVFLLLLQGEGLLRWHTVSRPARRGFILFYAHNTAVIRDRTTSVAYVVDSWFHDNGRPPEIVTLAAWKDYFRPPDENESN